MALGTAGTLLSGAAGIANIGGKAIGGIGNIIGGAAGASGFIGNAVGGVGKGLGAVGSVLSGPAKIAGNVLHGAASIVAAPIRTAGAAVSRGLGMVGHGIGFAGIAETGWHGYESYNAFKKGDTEGGWSEGLKSVGTAMQFRVGGTGLAANALKVGRLPLYFAGKGIEDIGNALGDDKNKDYKQMNKNKTEAIKDFSVAGAGLAGAAIGSAILPIAGTAIGGAIGTGAAYYALHRDEVNKNAQNALRTGEDWYNKLFGKEVKQENIPQSAQKAASSVQKPSMTQTISQNNTTNINIASVNAATPDAARKNIAEALKRQAQQIALNTRALENFSNQGNSKFFNSLGASYADVNAII
ncbi:unnamed protein product [Sphagnum jensenii]